LPLFDGLEPILSSSWIFLADGSLPDEANTLVALNEDLVLVILIKYFLIFTIL